MSRILRYLPAYEMESSVFKEIAKVEDIEFGSLELAVEELENQLSIDTATWALTIYERELEIKTDLSKDIDERRSIIKSRWRGVGKADSELIKIVADAYTNGEVEVGFDGRIIVTFTSMFGTPPNIQDAKDAVRDISPAHLGIVYKYRYLLIRDIHKVKTLKEMENIKLDEFAFKERK